MGGGGGGGCRVRVSLVLYCSSLPMSPAKSVADFCIYNTCVQALGQCGEVPAGPGQPTLNIQEEKFLFSSGS